MMDGWERGAHKPRNVKKAVPEARRPLSGPSEEVWPASNLYQIARGPQNRERRKFCSFKPLNL